MRSSYLAFLIVVAALATPSLATAKGPSQATVTGPNLAEPLVFGGGENAGTPIMALAEAAGFFPAAYATTPNPVRPRQPAGSLGPAYTITYDVPTGSGTNDVIRQDAYPYATPAALTYMPPGQPIFDMKTRGGWYSAGASLKRLLVTAGLPRAAPLVARRRAHAHEFIFGGIVAAAAAGAAACVRRRRSIGTWFRSRSTSDTEAPDG